MDRLKRLLNLSERAAQGDAASIDEIRIRVAEAHSGYRWRVVKWGKCAPVRALLPDGDEWSEQWPVATHEQIESVVIASDAYRFLPDWPRDIAAAFELGEEAKKRGKDEDYGRALMRVIYGDHTVADGYEMVLTMVYTCEVARIAQASPLDRCIAFLMACEEGGEGWREAN